MFNSYIYIFNSNLIAVRGGSIFHESMEEFIGDFSAFLDVQTVCLLNFMELYMLWRKFKSWDLLMSG